MFLLYRVIHKSLRYFRPLRYSNQEGHAEEEHVNRGRDTPKFLSYLTGARYVHPWWRGRCQSCSQVPATNVQRLWQEQVLLYRRGRKSRRDLWITLYFGNHAPYQPIRHTDDHSTNTLVRWQWRWRFACRESIWESGYTRIVSQILTLDLNGVRCQLHTPTALSAGKNLFTHWIGDWLESRAGIDFLDMG